MQATLTSRRPLDVALTLAPHGRGPGDPCQQRAADGSIWRTSLQATGPVTYRVTQTGRHSARCQVWGPGGAELLSRLPALLGDEDACDDFAPAHPILAEAHRTHPHLRIGSTRRVFEALVPAVLEQRVHTIAAHRSWRRLVRTHGTPAPGPAPDGMRVPPAPDVWRRIPSWEYHRANVDPSRSRAIVRAAEVADRLEALADLPPDDAQRRLTSLPGIGVWTAAEVAQRAFGDADALAVGDYNIARMVGWSLAGRPFDDDEMVEYLEDVRPHRYRAVRLLVVSGHAVLPKFGPRTPIVDHTWH
ncbi:DNA-3-methyladenine glycosylase 2 family protein [Rhodococcus sp. HNM0569]|uniref:DNA-3-methyladenine glycosylase family protein n=1 Tax=Rhodococcus sp. HNM0569 TaxID=2716340 RepID=UPI00146B633D|nr:DNA-3-methyladenine glycosylase 2 family protein [Rhodococcus sp. HNM0569]NLU83773.1 DNA-3-methyladenine glycosylase 2 family protein [Rhodococcus sp. HNM0569]